MVMPEKDPTSYSLLTYGWVVMLAVVGGVISHLTKLQAERKFSMFRFVIDIVTAGFVGVLTFWICEAAKMNPLMTASFIGISGHMGSRILFLVETILKKKVEGALK